ncbi:hypothetical protein HRW16_16555 [Streptomyces lunaelactis]|uniref:hypothetical protein n=1 Tax=Streptomyces lunaelactis TaxID=1535768 RepID=UPI0015852CDB|nr:hypothetical protein [Streptomyces lunaelactis]NUK36401.1 hypothetical protein [Streptomyces lunaelactis]NUK44081.1 hypothetical protein [Streptomyces lunaelactis]NUK93429.1 hypothetical protein [Streptomyces lunaelactis]NUL30897.1 hypothetical protein [Streptomyces lunaelactis]
MTVAGINFRCAANEKSDFTNDAYREVTVINESLTGDDPKYMRTFRYFTGANLGEVRGFFSGHPKKGAIGWPPFITHTDP